jgi:hypothetical protein
MNYLMELVNFVFAYCTDFIINLSNIFNLSYYEINFIMFCVLYPIFIIGSIGIYIFQKMRLKRLKVQNNT